MLLTDIAIAHTKRAGKSGPPELFIMHPFENSRGRNVGEYELLRNFSVDGRKSRNQSTHVTKSQLADLYARGVLTNFNVKLRVHPAKNDYPTAPPVKNVQPQNIKTGSEFDLLVCSVDTSQPISNGLAAALKRIDIHL